MVKETRPYFGATSAKPAEKPAPKKKILEEPKKEPETKE